MKRNEDSVPQPQRTATATRQILNDRIPRTDIPLALISDDYNIKPGPNAFSRNKGRKNFDPIAEEQHWMQSNAFYQRKISQSEQSPSMEEAAPMTLKTPSSSASAPLFSSNPSVNSQMALTDTWGAKNELKRHSSMVEHTRTGEHDFDVSDRPLTAMSHPANPSKSTRSDLRDIRSSGDELYSVSESEELNESPSSLFRASMEQKGTERTGNPSEKGSSTPVSHSSAASDLNYKFGIDNNVQPSKKANNETSKSPKKRLFGLNISVPNFRSNAVVMSDGGAQTSLNMGYDASKSTHVLPLKAEKLLGTEAADYQNKGKINAHNNQKGKRLNTTASFPAVFNAVKISSFNDTISFRNNRKEPIKSEGSFKHFRGQQEKKKGITGDDLIWKAREQHSRFISEKYENSQGTSDKTPPVPLVKYTSPKALKLMGALTNEVEDNAGNNNCQRDQHFTDVNETPTALSKKQNIPETEGLISHPASVNLMKAPSFHSLRASLGQITLQDNNSINNESIRNGAYQSEVKQSLGFSTKEISDAQFKCLSPNYYSPSMYSVPFETVGFRPSEDVSFRINLRAWIGISILPGLHKREFSLPLPQYNSNNFLKSSSFQSPELLLFALAVSLFLSSCYIIIAGAQE